MRLHLRPFVRRPLPLAALLVAALVGVPLGARATVKVSVTGNSSTTGTATAYKFGLAVCNGNPPSGTPTAVTFTVDLSAATSYTAGSSTVTAWAATDCSVTTTGSRLVGSINLNFNSGSTSAVSDSVNLSEFVNGGGCSANVSAINPGRSYFCVNIANGSTQADTGQQEIDYAFQPLASPTVAVEAGDQQLHLLVTSQTTSSDAGTSGTDSDSTFKVFVVTKGAAAPDPTVTPSASQPKNGSSSLRLDVSSTLDGKELQDGQPYDVYAVEVDSFGNNSTLGGPFPGTPVPIDDFYREYRNDGGGASGCSAAVAGWGGLLLAAGWLRRRRNRGARGGGTGGAALLVLLAALATGAARAEPDAADAPVAPSGGGVPGVTAPGESPFGPGPASHKSSKALRPPRRLFFAGIIDRYAPRIDSETSLGGKTPYHDIFHSRVPVRVQLQVGVDALRLPGAGTLLVGGSVGFWQNIGHGLYDSDLAGADGQVPSTCSPTNGGHKTGCPSNDTALLDIIPVGAQLTFRLDSLADRYRWFPLIPYAQVGLAAALWTAYRGNGAISNDINKTDPTKPGTGHGQGWTLGYSGALGLSVPLDAIDPDLSNEAYVDLGLQRTSLFVEYAWTQLDGFGRKGNLILTHQNFRFGLSLEF